MTLKSLYTAIRVHSNGMLNLYANRIGFGILGRAKLQTNPIENRGEILKIGYIRISTVDQNTARQGY